MVLCISSSEKSISMQFDNAIMSSSSGISKTSLYLIEIFIYSSNFRLSYLSPAHLLSIMLTRNAFGMIYHVFLQGTRIFMSWSSCFALFLEAFFLISHFPSWSHTSYIPLSLPSHNHFPFCINNQILFFLEFNLDAIIYRASCNTFLDWFHTVFLKDILNQENFSYPNLFFFII